MIKQSRARPQITLGQLIKLVISCAVVIGCLSPAIRPRGYVMDRSGLVFLVGYEAMALSLASMACTILLVRPGRARSIALSIFLLCSTAVLLAFLMFASGLLVTQPLAARTSPRVAHPSLAACAIVALLDLGLVAACILVSVRLMRLLRATGRPETSRSQDGDPHPPGSG